MDCKGPGKRSGLRVGRAWGDPSRPQAEGSPAPGRQPGQSVRPYADCRVEAQWTEIITISANAPVPEGESFVPNGWTCSGRLAEGDSVDSVTLNGKPLACTHDAARRIAVVTLPAKADGVLKISTAKE